MLRNRYLLKELLGRGGMADVFKASDGSGQLPAQPEHHVAVKVLRERIDQRPELLVNLRREFECTRKLSHPNIVKVYELDRDERFAFYTMELLDGEQLSDLLDRADRRPLPRTYAWAIIGAVGAALTHAHSRNVIHGDMSPRNVMITRSGEVRVLDFGSSRISNRPSLPTERAEGTAAVAATPGYASCELLEGQHADPSDDLYALACLAYDLLAGEHPFQGRRSTEARDLGMRPRRPPGVSFARWRTIRRGLSLSREERSIPVREWLAELGLEPEPERLPSIHDANDSAPPLRHAPAAKTMTPLIAAGICTAILGTAIAWQSLHRRPVAIVTRASDTATFGRQVPANPPIPRMSPPVNSLPSLPINSPSVNSPSVISPLVNAEIPSPESAPAAAPESRGSESSKSVRDRRAGTASPTAANSVIRFTAHHYAIHPGAHFAEIHLRRSRTSNDTNGFVWWTEESSAKAGIDFVAQERTPHTFSPGRRLATLFIRLIPNADRTQRTSLNVCVEPGAGSAPADFTCSVVSLPASTG
jgi:serine/threonine protein kinase